MSSDDSEQSRSFSRTHVFVLWGVGTFLNFILFVSRSCHYLCLKQAFLFNIINLFFFFSLKGGSSVFAASDVMAPLSGGSASS